MTEGDGTDRTTRLVLGVAFAFSIFVIILIIVACSSPRSKMDTDWDELTENQRGTVCALYRDKPEADFTGAAIDLGWELGTMMRFLERHC
jgi:hypothetical protein